MVLHESYCLRHLYKCEKCNQPVEKTAREAHNQEFHTPVPCPHCNTSQEKPNLENHVATCPKRPKQCLYCELELPFDRYDDHINICGSKTRQCPRCKRYIPKRYWEEHQGIPCEPEPVIPKEPIVPERNMQFVSHSIPQNVNFYN